MEAVFAVEFADDSDISSDVLALGDDNSSLLMSAVLQHLSQVCIIFCVWMKHTPAAANLLSDLSAS